MLLDARLGGLIRFDWNCRWGMLLIGLTRGDGVVDGWCLKKNISITWLNFI